MLKAMGNLKTKNEQQAQIAPSEPTTCHLGAGEHLAANPAP